MSQMLQSLLKNATIIADNFKVLQMLQIFLKMLWSFKVVANVAEALKCCKCYRVFLCVYGLLSQKGQKFSKVSGLCVYGQRTEEIGKNSKASDLGVLWSKV